MSLYAAHGVQLGATGICGCNLSAGRKLQEVVVPQLLHPMSDPAMFLDSARSCEHTDPGVPASLRFMVWR